MTVAQSYDHGDVELGPHWLTAMLQTTFFSSCPAHGVSGRKTECNLFCLDCKGDALCSLCLTDHRGHRVVQPFQERVHNNAPLKMVSDEAQPDDKSAQIRRSSYHNVIRVSEIDKILNISGVHTYSLNNTGVVFLNERPRPGPAKAIAKSATSITCETCERSLVLHTFRFCSLGCKLSGVKRHLDLSFGLQPRENGSTVSSTVGSADSATFSFSLKIKEWKQNHNSVRELDSVAPHFPPLSASTQSPANVSFSVMQSPLSTDMVSPPSSAPRTAKRRRKGISHRSPLQ